MADDQISKQKAVELLKQTDKRLDDEMQELGKVYLINGSDINKNGGAGIAMRNCYLLIDDHPRTRVTNNDFGFQVYIMLKECADRLQGFEKAINEGRIKGRKVLVGGGWG